MGWASAGYIFDPVARELQTAGVPDSVRYKVCKILIDTLQNGDWDTEEESLGEFQDDPVIVKAFLDNDIPLWGTPEAWARWGRHDYDEDRTDLCRSSSCELPFSHLPHDRDYERFW